MRPDRAGKANARSPLRQIRRATGAACRKPLVNRLKTANFCFPDRGKGKGW